MERKRKTEEKFDINSEYCIPSFEEKKKKDDFFSMDLWFNII